MTRTVLLTEHDTREWGRRFASGDVPAELPYGVDAMRAVGFDLLGVDAHPRRVGTKIRDVLEHRSGLAVHRPLRAAPTIAKSDLVLALLEKQGLLAGRLKGLQIPPYSRTPLVIWSCWLADDIRSADVRTRRAIARQLKGVDLITHLSPHESEIFAEIGIGPERLYPVTYGISHRYYVSDDRERDIDLLAVGQDRGRDYATLFAAVDGTDLRLDVITKPENLAGLRIPANVTVHGVVPLPTYRDYLRRAKVVAVPTRDLAYPTGSSVALEAASTGCAVAVTGTRAMRDYFVDGVNAVLVDEGDVEGWRSALHALGDLRYRDRIAEGGVANVHGRFNATVMWTELAAELRRRGIVPT